MIDGRWPFAVPPILLAEARAVLGGKYDHPVMPARRPRRVIDFGAGVGAYACWAWRKYYGEVFIDCYEQRDSLRELCAFNAPPGAMMHGITDPVCLPPVDVLRVAVADYLMGYPHLDVVGVVAFDWSREDDRAAAESRLASAGLRCFKLVFERPDKGHEVWVRSGAQFDDALDRYVGG